MIWSWKQEILHHNMVVLKQLAWHLVVIPPAAYLQRVVVGKLLRAIYVHD